MTATIYTLQLELVYPTGITAHRESFNFASEQVAICMAREYANCVDVVGVELLDNATGEILFTYDSVKGIWERG